MVPTNCFLLCECMWIPTRLAVLLWWLGSEREMTGYRSSPEMAILTPLEAMMAASRVDSRLTLLLFVGVSPFVGVSGSKKSA